MMATRYSINDIQREMREDGSHWWDAGTMETFGTTIESPVYQGEGGVFFVTGDKRFDESRGYTLREYNPESKDISTWNSPAYYDDLDDAIEAAQESANDTEGVDGKLDEVTPLDDFARTMEREVDMPRGVCALLIDEAKLHHELMERDCNEGSMFTEDGDPMPVVELCRDTITVACEPYEVTPLFSGDPRGATVKLRVPSGYTDDWGTEGICVPTAD